MRPPRRRLASGAGTARPPPLGRQVAAPGDQRPPPTPPPLPLRPKSGRRQRKETAAPHPPRRGRCTRGEGAPRPRQAPPVNRPHAPALPAADRRRTGSARDGANGAAPSEGGLGRAGAQTRAGGFPPPPSSPRRTDPLAAGRAALDAHGRPATPKARVYSGGARQRQRMAGQRPTGRGGRRRRSGPPSPPPAPPPSLRATGATLRPPGAEGTPHLPQKGTRRGGADAAGPAHRAPQRPQPPAPAGVAADGRARTSAPKRRADQAWVRHTAAHQNSMGAAPPMTPPHDHCPLGEGRGRVQV